MKKGLLYISAVFASLLPTTAWAVGEFQPLIEDNFISNLFSDGGLSSFFNQLFQFSITIGALLAVLMIAWSGWEIMTTDVVKNKGEAKERLQNALIGLLMLISTVLVLQLINPDIVSLRLLQNVPSGGTVVIPVPSNSFTAYPNGSCAVQNNAGFSCFASQQECAGVHGVSACTQYNITRTADPSGYCAEVEGGLYGCSATSAECAAVYGGNVCQVYGDNAPGSGYDEYRWTNVGYDENNNIRYCSAALGSGWVDVARSYCGATASQSGYSCCAQNIEEEGETDSDDIIGGEQPYPAESFATEAPDGSFCYRSDTTAYCLTTEQACVNNYEIRLASDPDLNSCVQIAN